MSLLVILFFLGLATATVGKIKGSSFLIWFVIGFCLPLIGLIAALFYRWERYEPQGNCPHCGHRVKLYDQVCMSCGEDLFLSPGRKP